MKMRNNKKKVILFIIESSQARFTWNSSVSIVTFFYFFKLDVEIYLRS